MGLLFIGKEESIKKISFFRYPKNKSPFSV